MFLNLVLLYVELVSATSRELPGGLVLGTHSLPGCSQGSVLGLGIEIPHQATACHGHRPPKVMYARMCYLHGI